MNPQQVYDYVNAVKYQALTEDIVNAAFKQLNPDNSILGTAEPIQSAYTKLISEMLTPEQFSWLEWYMYETCFAERSSKFCINNIWMDVQYMSFFKFWEIVNEL